MTLELAGISHRYGTEVAVEDVTVTASDGELLALVGPSGSGKSTLVGAIAGHIRPDAGRVRLRGTDVTDEPPEDRRVGIVFQHSTLFPHLTVAENVAYGLRARGVDADRRVELVEQYLDLVEVTGRGDALPSALSGGQRRRVELARALAPEPDVLLLDEPLSALDRDLRTRLREEIDRIQRETDVTTVFVTHDQEDAMTLADRIVVLEAGTVAGIGSPRELYESPPTPFVGEFLGRSSTLSGVVTALDPIVVAIGDTELQVDSERQLAVDEELRVDQELDIHVRPAFVRIDPAGGQTDRTTPRFEATVVDVVDVGTRYDVTVRIEPGEDVLAECVDSPPAVGDRCTIAVDRSKLTVFPA
ncbi:MAG: ABC transporter ATP-binding protein [Halobacteriota archaeon]